MNEDVRSALEHAKKLAEKNASWNGAGHPMNMDAVCFDKIEVALKPATLPETILEAPINHEQEPHCEGCWVLYQDSKTVYAKCNFCGEYRDIIDLLSRPAADREDARLTFLRDDRFTGRFIEEFVNDYTLEGDDGTHQPTEGEQFMLLDCCVGLVTELMGDEFTQFCDAALSSEPTETRTTTKEKK